MKTDSTAVLAARLENYRSRVDQALDAWLPAATTLPTELHAAMRYAVLGPGKRVRPALVYATGEALGDASAALDGCACAVELIHAYSLVHDDLPAMDNDDMRRGRPTCHKVFGEANALLAGDALQTLAFHILAHDPGMPAAAETRLRMIETLALAAGSRGMAGGQAMDLAAVGRQLNFAELEDMHIHKTGALIRASVALATLGVGDIDPAKRDALDHYAKCIGLAFQIRDDILDVEGTAEDIGKTPGADEARDKPTYPALLGLAGAKQRAQELHEEALESLSVLDENADTLRRISAFIVERAG